MGMGVRSREGALRRVFAGTGTVPWSISSCFVSVAQRLKRLKQPRCVHGNEQSASVSLGSSIVMHATTRPPCLAPWCRSSPVLRL